MEGKGAMVLTRKVGESIIISLEDGRVIEVFPKEIRRNQVRIAVACDRSIGIDRSEVYYQKQADKHLEAGFAPATVLERPED